MRWFILALLLTGCKDLSTVVRVSPFAEKMKYAEIECGLKLINEQARGDVYRVLETDDAERVDDEIVIRMRNMDDAIGKTHYSRNGTIVWLDAEATCIAVAHELGHSAGLHHRQNPKNIMNARAIGTELDENQIDQIWSVNERH